MTINGDKQPAVAPKGKDIMKFNGKANSLTENTKVEVVRLSNGLEGNISNENYKSPTTRHEALYMGPILADVENSMTVAVGLSKERKEIASGLCGKTITRWKRKERGETDNLDNPFSIPTQEARKRREVIDEEREVETGKQDEVLLGSGMAEAGEQPRRPR
jgi:hypothetical protein